MSKYDWGMVCITLALVGVAILMGCRPWQLEPWQRIKSEVVERIDIDISVDYCGIDSEGNDYCIPVIELDNIEEIVLG